MLIVKKFGGSSVANKDRIFNVAKRCIEDYKAGHDVVVVLSAMGDTTDELIALANTINPDAKKRELDMLLTTGEQVSVSLMAMAMQALDVPAVSLNAFQVMMHSTSRYGNARFKRVDTERIMHELDSRKIVIVTGFQGVNKYDDITTLGRGGSDTTAVALAAVLHADKCEIYTDVDGVFTADPRVVKTAKKLDAVTYDEMLELASLGAKVLHNRSVEMAKKYNATDFAGSNYVFEDGRFNGTVIPMWDSTSKNLAIDNFVEKYNIDLSKSYAYGDTNGDITMLRRVGNPIAINPTSELVNHMSKDKELKEKTQIIVERKDIIYSLDCNVKTLNIDL